jgi:lysophospholipase L1-like esterase
VNGVLSLANGDVIVAGMTEGALEGYPNERPGSYDIFLERVGISTPGPWFPRLIDPRPDAITLDLGDGRQLTLTGLQPGQRYSYRMEGASGTLEGAFRTLPGPEERDPLRLLVLPAQPGALTAALLDRAEQLQPQVLLAAAPLEVLTGAPLLQRVATLRATAGDAEDDLGPLTVLCLADTGAEAAGTASTRWEEVQTRIRLIRSAGRPQVVLLPTAASPDYDQLAPALGVVAVLRAPQQGLLDLRLQRYLEATTGGASSCLSITPRTAQGLPGPSRTIEIGVTGLPLPASPGPLDMTSPLPPRLQLLVDGGVSALDGLTNDPRLAISGLEVGCLWQWSSDGGRRWSDGAGEGMQLASDGSWQLLARQINRSGLPSPVSLPLTVTLDRQAPVATATLLELLDDHGGLQGPVAPLGVFSDRTPLLRGLLSAPPEPGERLQLLVNGVAAGEAVVAADGRSWFLQPALTVVDGPLQLQLQLIDGAGKTGPLSAPFIATLDSQTPTTLAAIMAVVDDKGLRQGLVAPGGSSDDDTPLLKGTLSGPLREGEVLQVLADGAVVGTIAAPFAQAPRSLTVPLPPGPGTVRVLTARVVDAAGNVGRSSAPRRLLLDTVAPIAAPCITTVLDDHGSRQGAAAPGSWISDRTPKIQGVLSAPAGVGEQLQVLDGSTLLGLGTLTPDRLGWTMNVTLPAAATAVSLRARLVDAVGNPGPLSPAYPLLVDSLAPTLLPTITTGGNGSDFNPVLQGTVPGALGPGEVLEALDGARSLGSTVADPLTGQWILPVSLAPTLSRQVQLRVRIVDAAGNTGPVATAPATTLASAPPAAPVLRVLPLGDSLTDGAAVPGGYRLPLQQTGQQLGIPLELVGRRQQLLAPDPSPDPDHWGIPGITLAGLTAQLPEAMASLKQVTRQQDRAAVLLLIGTNDLISTTRAAAAPTALATLLNTLNGLVDPTAPPLPVLLGSLPPLQPATQTARVAADTLALNAWISTAATTLPTPRLQLQTVDFHGPLAGLMDAGGLHPTAQGYGVMAHQWWQALESSGLL